MADYLVPLGYGEAEYTEKRSRFIGRIWQTDTQEQAKECISRTREQNPEAAHNVFAYIIRKGEIVRFSDDGEPGGTSGMPTLGVLRAAGVFDVCCVITRYFGGVLLGSGGLVRAYSKAAKLALDAAGVGRRTPWMEYEIACAYAKYEKICWLLESDGAEIKDSSFGEKVIMRALIPFEACEGLCAKISDWTAGEAFMKEQGAVFKIGEKK